MRLQRKCCSKQDCADNSGILLSGQSCEHQHGWRRAGGENQECVRRTSQPRPTSSTRPSIYGIHWIIYWPLPPCVWEGERRCADLTTTMLRSAPAAAAAVWLLVVLHPGLARLAEDASGSGFSLCKDAFYRQTPPQAAPAGPLLRPLCHRLPGGQAYATATKPTCDTTVFSAFRLGRGWKEREGQEEEELVVR